MKVIKFGGFEIGYKVIIKHKINGKDVKHEIIYELYDKDKKKVTDDKKEYLNFINYLSSEIIRRLQIVSNQLKAESRLIIPVKEKHVIVKIEKVDKKGNIKKWSAEYIVPSLKEYDSGLFKEKNGNELIVGYWEEVKLPKHLTAKKIEEGDLDEEDWRILNEVMKRIKVKW